MRVPRTEVRPAFSWPVFTGRIVNIRKALIPAALAATFTHVALAANDPAAVKGAQAIFDHLGNGQAHITHSFDGPPGSGLTGLAVNLGGVRNMVAYTTKDGQYIIVGAVFGADGENYSLKASQEFLPPPPPPPSAGKNLADIEKAHTFLWGRPNAPKALWAVMDPDCIFCHRFFGEIAPFVQSGAVKVHVLQVGFLKPDSLGKAAAILGAKDPAQALVTDETGFNEATEEGGIQPDSSDKSALGVIKANNAWMQAHGIGGTPYILYRGVKGEPMVMPGFPQNIELLLSQIGTHGTTAPVTRFVGAHAAASAPTSKDGIACHTGH